MINMNKINSVVSLLLAAALMASTIGCSNAAHVPTQPSSISTSTPSSTPPIKQAVTFVDALGRSVTVQDPQRVTAANGSYAEVWLLAGGELVAATEDAWYERELNLSQEVVSLGAMKSPSVEKLIELETDLVLLSSKVAEHVDLLDTLEAAGIQAAYFEVETFDDYLAMLKTCTDITAKPEMYSKNGEAVQAQIEQAVKRSVGKPSPTVLLIRAFSTGAKAKGSDNMAGIMLSELGCTNIADSDTGLLEDVSMEKVIATDPDYIFVVTMGESSEKALETLDKNLTSNPAWAGLSAVKNNRYVVLPKELFHYKPNNRWGESYEQLADILYGK